MMKRLLFLIIMVMVPALCATIATAHSTKGRLKIALDYEQPTYDDFAYFMESYVHRELHRDEGPHWKNRYYVNKFQEVQFNDSSRTAKVLFLCLDNKTKDIFPDSMTFTQGKDSIWFFTDKDNKRVEVYTYVKKTSYYYTKYVQPIAIAGMVLGLATLLIIRLIRLRRQRKLKPSQASEPTSTEMAG